MKYFLGLVWIFLSAATFAQTTDAAAKAKDSTAQQNAHAQIRDSAIRQNVVAQSKDTSKQKSIAVVLRKDTNSQSKLPVCQIILAGKLGLATDSTSAEEILADPVIRSAGCDNLIITSFEFVTNVGNQFHQIVSKNDHLTKEMIHLVKAAMQGTPIIIQSVHYQLPNGKTGIMPGILLCINK